MIIMPDEYLDKEMLHPYAYQVKASLTYDDGTSEDVYSPFIDSGKKLSLDSVFHLAMLEFYEQAEHKYGKTVVKAENFRSVRSYRDPRRI
jgi:hypothetical protein